MVALLGAGVGTAAAHAPHDNVPVLEVSPQFGTDGTLFAALLLTDHQFFGRSTDGGRTWEVTGPAMALEVLTAFAFSPDFARDGTAFAGTLVGGVYRTGDHGLSWQQLELGAGFLNVRDLDVSPDFAADGTVVAATSLGLLVSRDGGDGWAAANLGLVETDLSVVAFDGSGRRLHTGRRTLHVSGDGAHTWAPLATLPADMVALAGVPASGAATLAGPGTPAAALAVGFGGAGEGVALSTDGGLSFGPMNAGLGDLRVNSLAAAADGTLFAATWQQGVLRAAGPGRPWRPVFDGFGLTTQTSNHFRTVRASPDFVADGVVFAGTFEGLGRSDDRGDSWRQEEVYGLNVLRALALPGDFERSGTLFAGSYGGGLMRLSPDGPPGPDGHPAPAADDWLSTATGIVNPYSGALALSPDFEHDATLFWAYTSLHRSTDGGRTLEPLPIPDVPAIRALAVSPDFARDRTLVLGAGSEALHMSTDAGETWAPLPGLPVDPGARAIVFAPHFATGGTLFVATADKGLFRSDDRGQSWALLPLGILELRSLAVSPDFASDATLAAGTERDGLWLSRDGGATWERSRRGLPATPHRGIEAVAFSPGFATDGTLFMAPGEGGVWRSVDRGATWTDAGVGLPRQAGRKLAVSPAYPRDRTLVQTNHDWIWISRDAGASWTRLPGRLRADDGHQSVHESGLWGADGLLGGTPDFANGTSSTLAHGASAELTFFGNAVTWFARRGPDEGGIADVFLDGEFVRRVSLYAPALDTQVPVFQRDLPPGWHTIRVTHTGRMHPSGTSALIRSDGFSYRF